MKCPECSAEARIITIGAPIMGTEIEHKPGCKRTGTMLKLMKDKRYRR